MTEERAWSFASDHEDGGDLELSMVDAHIIARDPELD